MKALVTGGAGFIGSHVVNLLLSHGYEVRVFSRRRMLPEQWTGKAVSMFPGDLRDHGSLVGALEGMDLVFHLGEIVNSTKAASEENVRAVRRMVEELDHRGVRRLVFVSSISVAGIPSATPATETSTAAVDLNDHYTDYKRRVEQIIRGQSLRAEYAIVRPGIVYGPGSRNMKRLAGTLARAGRIGLPFPGGGRNLMPLVDVRDLARAIFLAGTRPEAAGQTFNLTDGERHTWADFLAALSRAQGMRIRIIPFPLLLLRLPAVFGNFAAFLLGAKADLTSYVDYFSRDLHFSADKAKALLEWRPEHTDLDESVREMLAPGT